MANFPEESGFIPQARASTFALPRFGMDGKDGDGDTCFFAHLISFLAIFSGFCPYVTGFLPLCHLCLKYLKPQVWQLPYLPYRHWTFVMESHSKTGREFLVFGINCAFLTFSSFPLYGIKNILLIDICSFFHPSASDILYITIQYLNIFSHHIILLSHHGWELFSLS